jgi:hypothetical protein
MYFLYIANLFTASRLDWLELADLISVKRHMPVMISAHANTAFKLLWILN